MRPSLTTSASEILKHTSSRCPVCLEKCPAVVERRGNRIFLVRECPGHGVAEACVASDARFYWVALGSGENRDAAGSGCGGGGCCNANGQGAGTLGRNSRGHAGSPFETLSTCLALIEIVHSCNLTCPTCYANSPVGSGSRVDAVPLADVQRRIDSVIQRKGRIEILQLSGGEPTLHPQLTELCRWTRDHSRIDFLLLNTNGVLLAKEPRLCAELGEIFRHGGLQIYLQFDGPQAAGQMDLRGGDLRTLRQQAIDNLSAADIPVTLAMTVTPDNLAHVWEAAAFGLGNPNIHGITFQPAFSSGRGRDHGRLNAADVLLSLIAESRGLLRAEDFTPLPCGDPNCAIIGYLMRQEGGALPISRFLDFTRLQGFLHDKVNYSLEDLAQCGCEAEPLGQLLKSMELRRSVAFRIMVKPFMDAWSWDDDRTDRCCTHVIRPDGKLDSFCRYYSGFPDCRPAP